MGNGLWFDGERKGVEFRSLVPCRSLKVMKLDARWHFVEVDNLWTWRLISPTDASVSSSAPDKDFGVIVSDALRNGFQPSSHHWNVITANGITRFEPGT